MRQQMLRIWLCPLSLVAVLAACQPPAQSTGAAFTLPDAAAPDTQILDAASVDTNAVADAAVPSDAGPQADVDAVGKTCPPAKARLRLLNRREYANTVRDLLPGAPLACKVDPDCTLATSSCVAGVCAADPCALRTFVWPAKGQKATQVHVAGTFNGWAATVAAGGWKMQYDAKTDVWFLKHVLADGQYQYKFVLDDGKTWLQDPANPAVGPDGYGGYNSLLQVGCAAQTPAATAGFDPIAGLPPESRPHGFAFDTHADAGLVTAVHAEQYFAVAKSLAEAKIDAIAAQHAPGCSLDAPATANCATQLVQSFGTQAFRRPLTTAEAARYVALITGKSASTLRIGAKRAVRALLVSPHFLYRAELGAPTGSGAIRHLTGYEIASAMSYFLWASLPDAALLTAAADGKLDTPAGRDTEARRMLTDPRARAVIGTFALQWLGVERVADIDKQSQLFPAFTPQLRWAMLEETRRFAAHVVFDGDHRLGTLLTANWSLLNADLAKLYGLKPAQDFAQLPVGADRAGVLGHASVLAATAHSDQTSPIRRGLLVRERLLCQPLGQPPPNAGGVPKVDATATTKDRFAQHTANAFCKSCHQYIDDIGFGFERFDPIGQWRVTEHGQPIDGVGDLNDREGFGAGTHAPFTSLPQLGQLLADSPTARRCFAQQVWRFAMGAADLPVEPCALDAAMADFAASGWDVRELLVSLVRSPHFVERQ